MKTEGAAQGQSIPFPLRHRPYRRGFDKVVLWYGRANVSPLHFDPNHNFMHQIDGQKRLLLVDPADSALLYADHAESAVGNTPINPFKVDTEAHPLVSHVTLWPVTLDRGDLLFIPSQWWHMVLTVPAFEEGLHPADVRDMALTAPVTGATSRRSPRTFRGGARAVSQHPWKSCRRSSRSRGRARRKRAAELDGLISRAASGERPRWRDSEPPPRKRINDENLPHFVEHHWAGSGLARDTHITTHDCTSSCGGHSPASMHRAPRGPN